MHVVLHHPSEYFGFPGPSINSQTCLLLPFPSAQNAFNNLYEEVTSEPIVILHNTALVSALSNGEI